MVRKMINKKNGGDSQRECCGAEIITTTLIIMSLVCVCDLELYVGLRKKFLLVT